MKPETRWKIACFLMLAVCVSLAFGFLSAYMHSRESDKALDAYIDADAKRKGFGKGEFEEPKIPDAPVGSKKIFTIEGGVTYAPKKGASRPDPTTPIASAKLTPEVGTARPDPAPAGIPTKTADMAPVLTGQCSLDEVGLDVKCKADGIAAPGAPYGRLTMSGKLYGFGQARDLPEMTAGDVKLSVAKWLDPATWHMQVMGGVAAGERLGLEFGLSGRGRSRFGWYSLVEYQPAVSGDQAYSSSTETYSTVGAEPSTWRVHAGMTISVR